MNIFLILPRIPYPVRDGGAVVMWQTLEHLTKYGHRVTVLVLNTSRHRTDADVLDRIAHRVYSVNVTTDITVYGALRSLLLPREPLHTSLPSPSYWIERFLSLEAYTLAEEILDSESFDVIQCESLFTAWYGIALTEQRRTSGRSTPPIVLRAHNVESRIMGRLSQESSRSAPERWYRQQLAHHTERFERAVAQSVHGVATLSEEDRTWFTSVAPSTPSISIPPGIVLASQDKHAQRQYSTLCLLASMEWAPNVAGARWFVREVLPNILLRRPDTVLHIAGRNPGSEILQLHNGHSIIVHGEIESASEFRAQHAISIVPLFSGSGIRIKILEALAAKQAVVSTSIGAEGLNVEHGQHLTIADTAEEFANACLWLLDHSDQAQIMGNRGAELIASNYSWESSIRALSTLYATLRTTSQEPAND